MFEPVKHFKKLCILAVVDIKILPLQLSTVVKKATAFVTLNHIRMLKTSELIVLLPKLNPNIAYKMTNYIINLRS